MRDSIVHPIKALSYLQPNQPDAAHATLAQGVHTKYAIPERASKLSYNQRNYRIALHSEDRIAGSATAAMFDLGLLESAWGLQNKLDVKAKHWTAIVESFYLTSTSSNASPSIVEIYGDGWPHQSESYDSANRNSSTLMAVAAGPTNAWHLNTGSHGFTLTKVPEGRVAVRLRTRDYGGVTDLQAALDADSTLRWHLLISLQPILE